MRRILWFLGLIAVCLFAVILNKAAEHAWPLTEPWQTLRALVIGGGLGWGYSRTFSFWG